MYKLYVRPHSDYGDVVYHNQNSSIGWESLAHRRWYRRLCLFYKIMNNGTPEYTRRYLPTFKQNPYDLRRPSIFAEGNTNITKILEQFLPILYQGLEQP